MGDQQSRHPGLIHSYANAVAGHPRLRNFEQSAADAIAISDADLTVGQAFHREVLSELPECEIASPQFALPVVIGIHLIDKHSSVFSTVTGQIALCVTINVEPPNETPFLHWLLPHGRVDSLTAPRDLAGVTHIN
jgi:hypothetical protein